MKLTASFIAVASAVFVIGAGGNLPAQSQIQFSPQQAHALGIYSPRDFQNSKFMVQLAQKVSTNASFSPLAGSPGPFSKNFLSFDIPGSGTVSGQGTSPMSINLEGTVTGSYIDDGDKTHAFIRTIDGGVVTFDAPGAVNGTYPAAINDFGVTAGSFSDVNNVFHGFVRLNDCPLSNPQRCTLLAFDAPGSVQGNTYHGTGANDINLEGEIDGYFYDASGIIHGFLRQPDGSFKTFDAPGAEGATIALGLNLSGALTGVTNASVAFVRTANGQITTFAPADASFTFAEAINLEGTIAGGYFDANFTEHGFVRSPSGQFQTFDAAIYSPCCINTSAMSINAFGTTVGNYLDGHSVFHGFRRTSDGAIQTFDASSAGTAASQGTEPQSINLDGMITGSYIDSKGVTHGFVIKEF